MLFLKSNAHQSGYRVLDALIEKGVVRTSHSREACFCYPVEHT